MAEHTPSEFRRAVACAVRARASRHYARQCRSHRQFYDAREAERDARHHEQEVRDIASRATKEKLNG